jgi:ubiquinone/menaquinone biosynthesis C-methylase UbiE
MGVTTLKVITRLERIIFHFLTNTCHPIINYSNSVGLKNVFIRAIQFIWGIPLLAWRENRKANDTIEIFKLVKKKGVKHPFIYLLRRNDLFDLLGNRKFSLCLDLGCDDSPFLEELLEKNVSTYIGVDLNSHELLENVKRYRRYSRQVSYFRSSASNLPLKHDVVDLVICTQLIEHLPDPEAVISEISRVLKEGGTLILSVPTLPIERIFLAIFIENTGLLKRKLLISEDHKREYTPNKIGMNFETISNLKIQIESNDLKITGLKSCFAVYNHLLFLMRFIYDPTRFSRTANLFIKADKILSNAFPDYGQYLSIRAEKRANNIMKKHKSQ